MTERIFGDIPSWPEGSFFSSRQELSLAGVHRPTQAGISGSASEGADSIVLSGGYEDDQDFGDLIVYTGHGGRDPDTGLQISDQLLARGNLALAYSCTNGLPIRVIRGYSHRSPYSPPDGYRYDGLFQIEEYWHEEGKSGHTIWRFRLAKIVIQEKSILAIKESQSLYQVAPRQESRILRIVRDTKQARMIKRMYDFHCQVCQVQLMSSAGPYAEAAHVRPLGVPHNGPDDVANLLCLCPNHHVLFDYGGFAIDDDFELLGLSGKLFVKTEHIIDVTHIRYHRSHFYSRI